GRVTDQQFHLCRTEVSWIYRYYLCACCNLVVGMRAGYHISLFIHTFTFELDGDAHFREGHTDEITNGSGYSCSDNEIFRFFLLQDQPHCLDIVLGMAPVAFSIQVTQVEAAL